MCSIDNMPAQLPREATDYFGDRLLPYIPDMVKSDASTLLSQYEADDAVKKAVITSNGVLAPNYTYIKKMREESK